MSTHSSPQASSHEFSSKYFFSSLVNSVKKLSSTTKKATCCAFFVIVFLGIFLRFYKLGVVPSGLTWDEAAIGYNGYSVWHIHRDEWLFKMPISFRSFGDYKAPLAIYINGLFTTVLGLNVFAVRLPFALFAIGAIFGTPLLTAFLLEKLLTAEPFDQNRSTAFIGSVLFSLAAITFSPWHIHFSRAGFESGIALTFLIWGVLFEVIWLIKKSNRIVDIFYLVCSVLCFVLSMYTYHSAKIVAPLLAVTTFIFFVTRSKKIVIQVIFGAMLAVCLLFPMVQDSLYAHGAERLQQTTFLTSKDIGIIQKSQILLHNIGVQFSPHFLFQGATTTLRHSDGKWGVLYLTDLLLICSLMCVFLFQKSFVAKFLTKGIHSQINKIILFAILWIVIGFIPTIIGTEVPHANRALLALPGIILLESVSVFALIYICIQISKHRFSNLTAVQLISQSIVGSFILIYSLLILSYVHSYFTQFASDSTDDFFYGYKQVFDQILPQEDAVDKILFTSAYGQPYIYTLFYKKTNAIYYQGGALIKYEFKDHPNIGDLSRKNALIVATPKEIDPSLADSLVVAPNGEVRFVIIRTPAE